MYRYLQSGYYQNKKKGKFSFSQLDGMDDDYFCVVKVINKISSSKCKMYNVRILTNWLLSE